MLPRWVQPAGMLACTKRRCSRVRTWGDIAESVGQSACGANIQE